MTDRFKSPRSRSAFAHSQSGTAGIEFAIVIPALLIGIFLVVEFGRIMYSKVEFDYAVFGATRFSSIAKTSDTTRVKQALSDGLILLDPAKLNPITLAVVPNGDKTSTATLTASYKLDSLMPLTSLTSMTLTRKVSFLINQ